MATHEPESTPRSPAGPRHPERREMITLDEAAAMCTVSYETFRRWVIKGVLPHVAVGPHHLKRVYKRDVQKLIRDVG